MAKKTIAEWDPNYADIAVGVDKYKTAVMDDVRTSYALEWLRENQEDFFEEGGWIIPKFNSIALSFSLTSENGLAQDNHSENEKKGGFGRLFVISNQNDTKCVVKLVSLTQLQGLGQIETEDDKKVLDYGMEFVKGKLEHLIKLTNDSEAHNLCQIQKFAFIPYVEKAFKSPKYNGIYSWVLVDYIICIKMELLQEMDYVRDFCGADKIFDEQLLIQFAIDMCNSLLQLKGYYHRDLHPKNFMLSLDERRTLKLIDFDTVLETGKNAPRLQFAFKGDCEESQTEPLIYRSLDDLPSNSLNYRLPNSSGNYDVYEDIYSAGCILYDIANYDYSRGGFNHRRYSEDGLLECEKISKELLLIIQKACSQKATDRYSNWKEFKKALLEIKDSWRKLKHIRTIPRTCEEWICRNSFTSGTMRVISAKDSVLKKEYEKRYVIYNTAKNADICFPSLIEKFENNGSYIFIEKRPPETSLSEYIKESKFDAEYYAFVRRFLKSYVRLLSINVRVGFLKCRKISTYRNLITSGNTCISNQGELWINGLALPEREYRYYLENSRNNYLLEVADKEENNEYTAVYCLGVLLYELLTGDNNITNVKPKSRINISGATNGMLLDLMGACLAAYDNKYIIEDITDSIDKL